MLPMTTVLRSLPASLSLSLSLIVRPTASRQVCLGIKHPSDAYDQIFISQTVAGLLTWGALSDERTELSFTIALGPRQRSLFRVRLPWDSWQYFTVSDSRLPFSSPPTTRRVMVEVFYPTSIQDAPPCEWITCSFVACWGQETERSLELFDCCNRLLHPLSRERVLIPQQPTCLAKRCHENGLFRLSGFLTHSFSCKLASNPQQQSVCKPLPSNGRLFLLHYSGLQPSCHNTFTINNL
jgi:hypothetical protein